MSVSTPSHWDREAALVREAAAADDAPADNVVAFLAMLAHAEGTPRYGNENGYNVLVGGGLFDDYSDHPRRSVYLPAYNIRSTAAGRYQFLRRTWDDLVERFGLKDCAPANQDTGAVALIRQCRALDAVHEGRVEEAIHACRRIWASLPGAGYGQQGEARRAKVAARGH